MAAQTYSLDLESGSSQYASITDGSQSGLDISGDITIEALVKLESLAGSGEHVIAGKYNGNAAIQYLFWIDGATGKLKFALSDDGSNNAAGHYQRFISTNALSTARWYEIAVAYDIDTETCTMYINGRAETVTKEAGTTLGASLYNGAANFAVGAYYSSGSPTGYFDGKIKNVRIWNTTRTQKQIIQFMGTTAVGETGLVSEWRFENNYNDSQGSNNLTSSGSPVFASDVPNTLGMKDVANWTKLQKIDVDVSGLSLSANLDLYPINITTLSDSTFSNLQSDGKDLRFTTDSAGLYEVPFELVAINTTSKTIEAWVLVPTVTYNASFTALYVWGKYASAVAYATTDIMGAQSVWHDFNSSHRHESSNESDSTVNGDNHVDTSTTYATEKIGKGTNFDGSADYITMTKKSPTGAKSFQFWFRANNPAQNQVIFDENGVNGNNNGNLIYIPTSDDKLHWIMGKTGGGIWDLATTITVTDNTLRHITLTWDGTTGVNKVKVYVNGASNNTTTSSSTDSTPANTPRKGSSSTSVSSLFNGAIDEFRVLSKELSADWIKTDYNLQNAPATYITNTSLLGGSSGMFLSF